MLRVSSTDGFAVEQIHTAPLSGSQNTNSNLQLLPSKQKVNDNLKKVHTHTHTHTHTHFGNKQTIPSAFKMSRLVLNLPHEPGSSKRTTFALEEKQ